MIINSVLAGSSGGGDSVTALSTLTTDTMLEDDKVLLNSVSYIPFVSGFSTYADSYIEYVGIFNNVIYGNGGHEGNYTIDPDTFNTTFSASGMTINSYNKRGIIYQVKTDAGYVLCARGMNARGIGFLDPGPTLNFNGGAYAISINKYGMYTQRVSNTYTVERRTLDDTERKTWSMGNMPDGATITNRRSVMLDETTGFVFTNTAYGTIYKITVSDDSDSVSYTAIDASYPDDFRSISQDLIMPLSETSILALTTGGDAPTLTFSSLKFIKLSSWPVASGETLTVTMPSWPSALTSAISGYITGIGRLSDRGFWIATSVGYDNSTDGTGKSHLYVIDIGSSGSAENATLVKAFESVGVGSLRMIMSNDGNWIFESSFLNSVSKTPYLQCVAGVLNSTERDYDYKAMPLADKYFSAENGSLTGFIKKAAYYDYELSGGMLVLDASTVLPPEQSLQVSTPVDAVITVKKE